MRGVSVALAVLFVAAAAVSVAWAESVERVRVPQGDSAIPAEFPPGVSLAISSPPDYVRAAGGDRRGSWTGPRFAATGDPANGGSTSISWSVEFDAGSKTADQAVASAMRRSWPVDVKGGMSVPHVVGKRTVGTILGSYILARSPAPANASYEAALAFPIAPRVHALVRLELRGPAGDSAGPAGTYLVKGSLPASLWNRGQAFWVLAGVRLEGNLAPTRVVARAARGGAIRGSVADAFRHPVVGARVAVERLAGGAWRRVSSTRTSPTGKFAVAGVSPGRYRVAASVGASTARSAPVVVGRGRR